MKLLLHHLADRNRRMRVVRGRLRMGQTKRAGCPMISFFFHSPVFQNTACSRCCTMSELCTEIPAPHLLQITCRQSQSIEHSFCSWTPFVVFQCICRCPTKPKSRLSLEKTKDKVQSWHRFLLHQHFFWYISRGMLGLLCWHTVSNLSFLKHFHLTKTNVTLSMPQLIT